MNRILLLFLCFIAFSALVFSDTWQETSTADFSAGTAVDTQVISDAVQLAEQSAWWNPADNWWTPSSATWWDASWSYRKAITVNNQNSSALADYQIKIENPVYNETGLVGSWHFNEGSGSVVRDSSGIGNDATVTIGNSGTQTTVATAWTNGSPGKSGSGLNFDGTDDEVQAPDSPTLDITNAITLSAWVKPSGFPNAVGEIISKWNYITNNRSFLLDVDNFGNPRFYVSSDGIEQWGFTANASIPTSSWTHITAVSDGAVMKIYINGVQDPATLPAHQIKASNATCGIGNISTGGGGPYYFAGVIDEPRIYNRALSTNEIASLFAAKIRPDYEDIRFVNSSGNELPFWKEKDGAFRVKFSGSMPSGISTLYAYYGNSSAQFGGTYAHNGTNTFDEYDEFDTLAAWSTSPLSTPAVTDTAHVYQSAYSAKIPANLSVEMKQLITTDPFVYEINVYDDLVTGKFAASISTSSTTNMVGLIDTTSAVNYIYRYTSYAAFYDTKIPRSAGWHTLKHVYDGTNLTMYIDDKKAFGPITPTGETPYYYIFANYWSASSESWFDSFRIRKYAAVEPVISIGTEIPQTSSQQWQYRKAIMLNNSSASALSNYPVRIDNPVFNENGLIGSWHFDDVTGSTPIDTSGNGNNGTTGYYTNDDPTSGMLSQSGLISFTAANAVDNNTATNAWHTDTSVIGAYLRMNLGAGNGKSYGKARLYASAINYAGNYKIQYSDDGAAWTDAASGLIPYIAGWTEKTWNGTGSHQYWQLVLTNTPGGGSWITELEMYTYTAGFPTTVAGKYGNALSFDSTDDYVNIAYYNKLPVYSATLPYSVSLWVKGASGQVDKRVFAEGSSTTNNTIFNLGTEWPGGGNKLDVYIRDNSGVAQVNHVQSTTAVFDGSWHHVVWTDIAGNAKLYIDGVLDATNFNYTPSTLTLDRTCIGALMRAVPQYFFSGTIDEVRVYNRVLSTSEIASLFAPKLKPNYEDIRFTDSSGNEIPYWMEKDGACWVKPAGIPTGLSSIYMYYGNASSKSTSNGTAVFDFFDDFLTNPSSTWTNDGAGSWSWDNSNGWYVASTNTGYPQVRTASQIPLANLAVGWKWRTTIYPEGGVKLRYNGTDTYYRFIQMGWNNVTSAIRSKIGTGSETDISTASDSGTVAAWYKGEARAFGNALESYRDDALINAINDSAISAAGQVTLTNYYTNGVYYVDYVYARQYVSPEPAAYAGSEVTSTSNWPYRKSVTVTNSGIAALSDYQVKTTNPFYDETGLAGSWHFDGASSGYIYNGSAYGLEDTSGSTYSGSNGAASNANGAGMQWTAGKYDGAVSLDGTDDFVTLSNSVSLSGEFTFACWFNKRVSGTFQSFTGKDADTGGAASKILFLTDNQLLTRMTGGGSSSTINIGYSSSMDNAWNFLVVQRDASNMLKASLNGANLISGSALTGTFVQNLIGKNFDLQYFSGSLDEVRFYSRALSQTEINNLYQSKVKMNYADIRFANGSGLEYPYWMEKDGAFWIKAAGENSIPAGTSVIYLYYGNSAALNASNGADVFYFFDDFSDGNYASNSNWSVSSGTWSASTNKLGGSTNNGVIYTAQPISNFELQYDVKIDNTADVLQTNFFWTTSGHSIVWGGNGNFLEFTQASVNEYDQGGSNLITAAPALDTNWHRIKMTKFSYAFELFFDDVSKGTVANSTYKYAKRLSLGALNGATTRSLWWDNFRIRKYSTPDPSASSAGAEQLYYRASGTFTSSVKDTDGDDTIINSAAWTATGAGTIVMQVRASNTNPAGWSGSDPAWEDVTNGNSSISAKGRYLQYKAAFAGNGSTAEPALTDITITYTYPITPPENSVSCDKLTNNWYSTATFTFANNTGFGTQIDKYYYAWDNTSSHTFTLAEPVWNSSTPQLQNSSTSDGLWYFHYLPYSLTGTPGTAQDIGPYKYDDTAPSAPLLSTPADNASISSSTTSFSWQVVTDTSGITYTLQMDNYASFSSLLINKTNLTNTTYTLNGTGNEVLTGNSTYYWRVIAVDGAGNSATAAYRGFTASSSVPQVTNESTGESFTTLQDAIDDASTIDGDVIDINDSLSHQENITLSKDIVLENGILSPSNGFAVTGQGATGGEILRNCVITSGGISNLALGENLTIFNPDSATPTVIENSTLVNCLIELGATITNSTLTNCYIEASSAYFVNTANDDFHLTSSATYAIDQGKNLSAEFIDDKDGQERGIDILDIDNFDTGAWDIGAYEFIPESSYLNPGTGGDTGTGGNTAEGYALISVSPAGLIFDAVYGSTSSATKTIAVYNGGTEDFTWTASENAGWLTLSPSSGTSSALAAMQATADPANLTAGTHTATIIITSGTAANSPVQIPVDLVITAVTGTDTGTDSDTGAIPLTAPTLLNPINGAMDVYPAPVLSWDAQAAINAIYVFQMSKNAAFTDIVVSKTIEIMAYQSTGLQYGQTYYWRVKTVSSAGTSDWSETWSFRMRDAGNDGSNSAKTKGCFLCNLRIKIFVKRFWPVA
ncbi:MAG: DUF2341 domain-containing protein [Planctomycetes bacterium]|nr:DUF2341 domain-containing protein [Planctomycetota bacterium]